MFEKLDVKSKLLVDIWKKSLYTSIGSAAVVYRQGLQIYNKFQ